ncbi:MAG: hypothetical protein ACPL7E_04820, partial [bacterium]
MLNQGGCIPIASLVSPLVIRSPRLQTALVLVSLPTNPTGKTSGSFPKTLRIILKIGRRQRARALFRRTSKGFQGREMFGFGGLGILVR